MTPEHIQSEIDKISTLLKERHVSTRFASGELDRMLDLLDTLYRDHEKNFLPVIEGWRDAVKEGVHDIGKIHNHMQTHADLGVKIALMQKENTDDALAGQVPRHSEESIWQLIEQQRQNTDDFVVENLIPPNLTFATLEVTTEHFKTYIVDSLRLVRNSKRFNRLQRAGFWLTKAGLYVLGLYFSSLFSERLKLYGDFGFIGELAVALFCLLTVDRVFEWVKEYEFWRIMQKLYNRHRDDIARLAAQIEASGRIGAPDGKFLLSLWRAYLSRQKAGHPAETTS